MSKKLPIFLITSIIPLPFLALSYQNVDYFEINKSKSQPMEIYAANFTWAVKNFEVERQADSVFFEWKNNKDHTQNKEIRRLGTYWFDKKIKNKVYPPGSRPEVNRSNFAFEYCENLENCKNWQFFLDESKFRHWKKETIFRVYGEYDKSIFDQISLIITSDKHSLNKNTSFNVAKNLNKHVKEKINNLEKNFKINNFRILNIIYRIGFEITEDKIKNFTINLQFNYNYQKPILKLNSKLTKYLEDLKKSFNTKVINNNKIVLLDNQKNEKEDEIRNFALSPTSEMLEKLNEKVDKLSKLLFKNGPKYNASLKFDLKSHTKIEFFLNFQHPEDKNYYNFALNNNVRLNFSTEKSYNQGQFWKRLTIIPGKIYDQKDYKAKTDEPIKIKAGKNKEKKENFDYIYGGKWEYHDKIRLNFFAEENENEILYVNGKPIDVLDRNFNYELDDLRLDQKNKKSAINQYKIEIKKFEKSNKTQDNSKLIALYEIEFVIKAANSVMDIKWFAWDPQNNEEQQKLIEPYLKDTSGTIIYDNFGSKAKNPKFDPLIDKETGTKKQIVWVLTGNNLDSLPENSNFAQLPSEIFQQNVKPISDFGFIAEASVSGKGANITLNSSIKNEKVFSYRYQVDSNNKEKFEILGAKNHKSEKFNITNSTNKYFSNSGIWLFSSQFDKGLSSYKIVSIGENASAQLFSDVFPNKSIIPFWESKPGQILSQNLLYKKMTWKEIKNLSYEQILLQWRNFIENLVKKQTLQKINTRFDINYLIKNRIILAIKQKKITKNSLNFKNNNNSESESATNNEILEITPEMKSDLLKIILAEDEEISKNELTIENVEKNSDGSFNFDISIKLKNDEESKFFAKKQNKFSFKNINIEDSKINSTKTKINFDTKKINLPSNVNFGSFFEIIKNFLSQENADKVDIFLEEENNNIYANFKVKREYENDFFVEKPFILLKKIAKTSVITGYTKNIFDELDLDRINLAGISRFENAKKIILTEIEKSWKNEKYKFNSDFIIDNFDGIVEKVVKNIEENDQLPHKIWKLELRIKPDSSKNFYGSKIIKLVNIIGSLVEPKIDNLNQIRATQFSFSVSKHSGDLEKALKDHVYNLLLPEEIDAKKYLYLQNLAQIAHEFRLNPNLDRATLILEPGTSQLNGKKELTVFNSDFSPLGNLNDASLNQIANTKNIFEKKTTLYWLIPVIIFMSLGIVFLGFWIFNKFIVKFKN
ncbi:hypothetical protein DR095_01435 [Mycoplasma flocculare]|uniref:Mbov_0399 family ICE element protein n=1 Tax=Mesomycoplasma flocculare TaxID=2128 RepID=UPI00136ABC5C|nr:hypothetical protein [Mesomycoplasma flocculare]MXR13615.1 hypothetical protein [Mesomycoplasma flocculare]MXR22977.1 hypothetical protein [Mesomycoplasma flocculare]MXR56054.1 hypothetical protein [Mesomycoplasma flocculare]